MCQESNEFVKVSKIVTPLPFKYNQVGEGANNYEEFR